MKTGGQLIVEALQANGVKRISCVPGESYLAVLDALYDTGIDAEFGDQLLTLSTCEYTYKNGRFVVVAKKVI